MRLWLERWKQKCEEQQQQPGTPQKRRRTHKGGYLTPTRKRLYDADWASDASNDSEDSNAGDRWENNQLFLTVIPEICFDVAELVIIRHITDLPTLYILQMSTHYACLWQVLEQHCPPGRARGLRQNCCCVRPGAAAWIQGDTLLRTLHQCMLTIIMSSIVYQEML